MSSNSSKINYSPSWRQTWAKIWLTSRKVRYIGITLFMLIGILSLLQIPPTLLEIRQWAANLIYSYITIPITSTTHKFASGLDIKGIEALKEENMRLKYQVSLYEIVFEENKKLKKLLQMQQFEYPKLYNAQIIATNIINHGNEFIITSSKKPYKVGAPVVLDGYLIGKIIDSNNKIAKVLPYYDSNFRIEAISNKTGIRCILAGTRELGKMEILFWEKDEDYNNIPPDELMICSGENSPYGLKIGHIKFENNQAYIEVIADITKSHYVQVVGDN